jgi:hypothetical protein
MTDDRTMRVSLDDTTLLESAGSLGEALDAGRDAAERRGRIIVEVLCDGEPASPEVLSNAESLARPGLANEVSLVSAEPRELVATTFDDAASALQDLRETQRDLAERIHKGNVAEATGALGEVLEVWSAARQALEQGAEMAAIDLTTDDTVADLAAGLTERLREVMRAVEQRDWSTLADELEYDLSEQAERWAGKFMELSSTLRR